MVYAVVTGNLDKGRDVNVAVEIQYGTVLDGTVLYAGQIRRSRILVD